MTDIRITPTHADHTTVREIASAIHSRFARDSEQLAKAHLRLWKNLGKVYEEAHRIEASPALKAALAIEVNLMVEVQALSHWDAQDKSVFENLLVLAEGYDDKESTRSQYLAAMRNAVTMGVQPEEKAFADWVAKRHGIINAGRSLAPFERQKPSEILSAYVQGLEPMADESLAIGPLHFKADENEIGLLIVRKLPNSRGQLIDEVDDPRLVAGVISAIQRSRTPKAPTPARLARMERKALYYMNRFVLKERRYLRGKPKFADQKSFMAAVRTLASEPSLRDRYFDGEPGYNALVDSKEKLWTLDVANPDFHELDPGRFVENAKRGVLRAYPFDESKSFVVSDWDLCEPIRAYLDTQPKRRRTPEPQWGSHKPLDEILHEPEVAEQQPADELETA